MKKPLKSHKSTARLRALAVGALGIALAVFVTAKAVSAPAGESLAQSALAGLAGRGAEFLFDMELSAPDLSSLTLESLLSGQSNHEEIPDDTDSAPSAEHPPVLSEKPLPAPIFTPGAQETQTPTPRPTSDPGPGSLFYEGEALPPQNSGVDNSKPISGAGITIRNKDSVPADIDAVLKTPLDVELKIGGPSVLIIHTHGSESYSMDAPGEYEMTDNYRTEDKEHNIVRIGDVLAEELARRGISVIHDRGLYDYPSYTGAYGRMLEVAKDYLKKYPTITMVLDLHRDAITAADGTQFKTIADINGDRCSQILFVVGSNGSGLEHPEWRKNLNFALRLTSEMNRSYPSLSRAVTISKYRYNQHLTPLSLIVEVGTAGNTLSESERAIKYFAEVYANVVLAE
ncbi:MAG: stage II sporulation protein P [Oscillospiraceae bacterium]|nr:stage II sporulation protein P [Oscillospiraceae bacterium]